MLRWLFKWVFRVGLALVLLALVLALSRNLIVRMVVEHRVTKWTGLETIVGRASFELGQPRIVLRDVRLNNPPGVGRGAFLDIPLVVVDYDPQALLFRQLRVRQLYIKADIINLSRRDLGHSTQATLERALGETAQPGGAPFAPLTFVGLDRLQLSLGSYQYLDYYQMQLSREMNLSVTNFVVSNVAALSTVNRALQRLAADKGLAWPPSDLQPFRGQPRK